MIVNEMGGIVDLDHGNLAKHDDVECHCHVHVSQDVTEVLRHPLNLSIDVETKDLEANSDEDHDVVWEGIIFSPLLDARPVLLCRIRSLQSLTHDLLRLYDKAKKGTSVKKRRR